jgi:hypothetical protein
MMESENKSSWAYQREKIFAICKKYNDSLFVGDSTGVGDPIVEDLYRAGVRVYHQQKEDSDKAIPGFKFTAISKERLIEKLKIAIEMKMIRIPRIPELIEQLIAFECISMPSGKFRYSAPEGKHDDCVIALALALWGTDFGMYEIYKAPKPYDATDEFWSHVKQEIKNNRNVLPSDGEEIIINEEEGKLIGE